MKKIALFTVLLGMAATSQAAVAFKGVGWDQGLGHVTARLGFTEFANLDVGLGFNFDGTNNLPDNQVFTFGLSGFFLGKLQDWGPVDNYFVGGMAITKRPDPTDPLQEDSEVAVNLYAGLQPELTLMEHIAVAIRLGLDFPVAPDVIFRTSGQPISMVQGLNFKILF